MDAEEKQNEEATKTQETAPEPKKDNNLTVSTKLSTDRLICKTPRESPNGSVRSHQEYKVMRRVYGDEWGLKRRCAAPLGLGVMQVVAGVLMVGFGMAVIMEEASLSQLGGGIWGGCLAVATGAAGVLAGAKGLCPLKSTPQRVAHTTFLALSMISFAVSQLVLVLAAIGLARDLGRVAEDEEEDAHYPTTTFAPLPTPPNYVAVLSGAALVVACAAECLLAACSAYRSARSLCPCFRGAGDEEALYDCPQVLVDHRRDALVTSWLGGHSPAQHQQQFYVIASTLGRGSKLSAVTPIYALPPPPPPPVITYPLIPAPLGPVPSPVIRPPPAHRRHHGKRPRPRQRRPDRPRQRSGSKERTVTEEDVAKTYTGLDRAIAEEFIEICEGSKKTSLCSESSESSACRCQHPCSGCANTCAAKEGDGKGEDKA